MPNESQSRPTAPSPEQASPARGRRGSVAQRALARLLVDRLATEGEALRVIDLGGGTGGVAAMLAEAGHRVLVVDPSPDALAATARRSADLGLGDRLIGRQGDTTTLDALVEPASADVVLCHRVLDRVAGTAEALAAMTTALRPGGLLSMVIDQRYPKVLKRAAAGSIEAAADVLADVDLLDRPVLVRLLGAARCAVEAEQGLGLIADRVDEATVDGAGDALLRLEIACASNPAWLETATRLHLLARRE